MPGFRRIKKGLASLQQIFTHRPKKTPKTQIASGESSMDLPNTDIEIFDTFHCFPQLPAEIRLKIWAFTFPGPRVAEVSWSASSESWNSVPESHNVACSSSLVNHEARHEFLLSWRPLFLRDPASDAIAVEYFNPAIDTLYIGAGWTEGFEENSSFTENACRALSELWCTPQLRSLACEIREWENGTPRVGRDGRRIPRSPEWESDILSLFPALESFVIADYDYDWICIEEGMKRGRGPVELVEPTQMDPDNPLEMAPRMLQRLEELRKGNHDAKVPPAALKEVRRGGVLMKLDPNADL